MDYLKAIRRNSRDRSVYPVDELDMTRDYDLPIFYKTLEVQFVVGGKLYQSLGKRTKLKLFSQPNKIVFLSAFYAGKIEVLENDSLIVSSAISNQSMVKTFFGNPSGKRNKLPVQRAPPLYAEPTIPNSTEIERHVVAEKREIHNEEVVVESDSSSSVEGDDCEIEQGYKSLLPLNEEDIFENVLLVVVKMKSGIMKVVNMKFPQKTYIRKMIIFNLIISTLCFTPRLSISADMSEIQKTSQSIAKIEVPTHRPSDRVVVDIKWSHRLVHFTHLTRVSRLGLHRIRRNGNWIPLLPNLFVNLKNCKTSVFLGHKPGLLRILPSERVVRELCKIQTTHGSTTLAIIRKCLVTPLELSKLLRELIMTVLHNFYHLSLPSPTGMVDPILKRLSLTTTRTFQHIFQTSNLFIRHLGLESSHVILFIARVEGSVYHKMAVRK
ncbi:hypothetical protein YC2023_082355 [Brassica napus]